MILAQAIAGAADMVSLLFRSAIWNQTIPGQLRAASVASATSLSFSVTSGGIICVLVVLLLAGWLPKFRKYDVETNEYAVHERKIREIPN